MFKKLCGLVSSAATTVLDFGMSALFLASVSLFVAPVVMLVMSPAMFMAPPESWLADSDTVGQVAFAISFVGLWLWHAAKDFLAPKFA